MARTSLPRHYGEGGRVGVFIPFDDRAPEIIEYDRNGDDDLEDEDEYDDEDEEDEDDE